MTSRVMRLIGDQCRRPKGWLGRGLGHLMAWEHRPLTNWAVGLMGVRSTDHVLDVGCGGGMAIKTIASITVDGFVAGIDHSREMVQQARRRNAAAARGGRVEVRHGDVAALPYGDASFDQVVGIETFCFWPDPVTTLQEIYRVTKAGGLITMVMDDSKESPSWQERGTRLNEIGALLYSGAEVVALFTAVGFSRAWFETALERGRGWLCAQGVK